MTPSTTDQAGNYEIRCEPDEGFRMLANGVTEVWTGWRVKYRPLGSRGRWRSFLTDSDLPGDPEALQEIVRKVASR